MSKEQEILKQLQLEANESSLPQSKTQPQNMEVHHHPNVEKKKFKEYFLEFLMIFLAVTLGFFAENIRESMVEKETERTYIESFYKDISNDEQQIPRLIKSQGFQIKCADSLVTLLDSSDIKKTANFIYY